MKIFSDEAQNLVSDFEKMQLALRESSAKEAELLEERKKTAKNLEQKVAEIEKTKIAMLNLLEDSQKLEHELREERDRADAVISSVGEGIFVIDKDYIILSVNPVAEKLFDLPKENLLGKDFNKVSTLLKGDSLVPLEKRCIVVALKTGKTQTVGMVDDRYWQTPSGKKFPVRITATPLLGNGVTGAIVVFNDVTLEKNYEEKLEAEVVMKTRELREEEARLVASINALQTGFILADKADNIIIQNSAVKRILEKKTGDLTIPEIFEMFKDKVDLRSHCDKCMKEKKIVETAEVLYGIKTLKMFFSPVIMIRDHEEVIGYVFLIEDITEAKALERSKEEFFAVASHEMRTPLTAIRGNMALIRDFFAKEIKSKEVKEMIEDSYKGSVRLIGIVNDFLDASRLEQGRITLKKEKFDIMGLIKEVVREVSALAKSKKLSITLRDSKNEKYLVVGDKDRAKQVIYNLVSNALNYTQKGGVVLDVKKGNISLKISVSDTGVGILPQNQSLLFRKFQQAGKKVLARDLTKSSGLGLYISKLLVEGMGGKIWLEKSDAGKGSVFSFTLPLS